MLSAYPDLEKLNKKQQKWVYQDVPERQVLKELQRRATLKQTVEVSDGGYIDYSFEGESRNVTIETSQ